MTTTPDLPIADDDEPAGPGSSQPESAPGAEIGMSEKSGGTFEPEEDPEADD